MSAIEFHRTMRAMQKMAPGTMGGQSRVATPPAPSMAILPPSETFTIGCPRLVHTWDVDFYGWYPTAVCTWAGGTKISVLNTGGSEIHTLSYPGFNPLHVRDMDSLWSGFDFINANMAVTDDGIAWFWGADGTSSNLDLFRVDLEAGTASKPWTQDDYPGVTFISQTDGPSWNPYDGYLYDTGRFGSTVNQYRLFRIDPNNPGVTPETIYDFGPITGIGAVSNVSESIPFTRDGALWVSYSTDSMIGGGPTRLLSGVLSFPDQALEAESDGNGIPVSRDSIYFPTVEPTAGAWLVSGRLDNDDELITRKSACDIWTGDGTARMSTGVAGFSVFLFPTTGGVSDDGKIYEQRNI